MATAVVKDDGAIHFGFHRSNYSQLSLHLLLAVLIGVTLRLTTFKEATDSDITNQIGDKYVVKTSFLVSFGFTKALSNLLVGRVSDVYGRKLAHTLGWGFGVILGGLLLGLAWSVTNNEKEEEESAATLWIWYVGANICLGAQQGWTWTTNIFMFLDILGPENRAMASAISNSAGYLTSAVTTYAAAALSTKEAFWWVLGSSLLGCAVSFFLVKDTTPFVHQEEANIHSQRRIPIPQQEMVDLQSTFPPQAEEDQLRLVHPQGGEYATTIPTKPSPSSFGAVFVTTCWYNPSAAVLCWGGLTANLVTSLAWGLVLIWGAQQGLSTLQLAHIGSAFTLTKGTAMLVSGYCSDRIARRKVVLIAGYLVAALGLLVTAGADNDNSNDLAAIYNRLLWGGIIIGSGIGSVYCILTAGLSDHTPPQDRASAIGRNSRFNKCKRQHCFKSSLSTTETAPTKLLAEPKNPRDELLRLFASDDRFNQFCWSQTLKQEINP
ncbi:Major facilitator superfamily [Seminavis robusta]|uniref:Major facilitator superfamily n=1 Tax=Seminavis robusta TaxID=568900 RepID=A0A9N8EZJ2_9STRA|nr:Major facilitator superfamily [Seminavis robusta]|eukprot:Sro2754_g336250.1 Major facilitator superfamily (492) ;mRNA; f:680-2620